MENIKFNPNVQRTVLVQQTYWTTELYSVMCSGDPGLESSSGDRFREFRLQITSCATSSKTPLNIY